MVDREENIRTSAAVSPHVAGRELTAREESRVARRRFPIPIRLAASAVIAGLLAMVVAALWPAPPRVTKACTRAQARCTDHCTWDALFARFAPEGAVDAKAPEWEPRRSACIDECRQEWAPVCSQDPAVPVTIADLQRTPAKYDGRRVVVRGYSELPVEHCCMLFPTRADRDAHVWQAGVRLVPFWGVSSTNELILFAEEPVPASRFPNDMVVVEGVFRRRVTYVEGEPPGITDVNRFVGAGDEASREPDVSRRHE